MNLNSVTVDSYCYLLSVIHPRCKPYQGGVVGRYHKQPFRQLTISCDGLTQTLGSQLVRHDPADTREHPVTACLLSTRLVIVGEESTLAHDDWQALTTSVYLDEPV